MHFKKHYKYINPQSYLKIFTNPQWYLILQPELAEYFYNYDGNSENKSQQWLAYRKEFISMVSEVLGTPTKNNQITLAKSGPNWDEERLPVDTIIIHHSSTPPDTPIETINALGLLRLYAAEYSREKSEIYGQPLWSNHFYKEKPTFIAYHYLIKEDGTVENILGDNQIGWHAGNWQINCRSIAMCFLDDLKEKTPTTKALQAARKIVKQYPHCKILGHNEVNTKTTCPGKFFMGEKGWQNTLTANFE